MKTFAFPLDRVMEFRRMQARLEEIKLESMYAELRSIDTKEVALIQQGVASEKAIRAQKSVTGFDLEMFHSYREAMHEERRRMDKARAECRGKIDAQLQVVSGKRRDVKLLEHLKSKRFGAWEKEMFKELDQQAEEAYLAKWNRG
jgi:flagellar export protein FliJ